MSHFQVLTSTNPAAIAVVHLSGPRVADFFAHHVRFRSTREINQLRVGELRRAELLQGAEAIDDILVSVHAGPPAWDVRLHLHGSRWLIQRCCELAATLGFAMRTEPCSSLWSARNAIEAEAFALLPAMATLRGVQWLIGQVDTLTQVFTTLQAAAQDHALDLCRAIAARRPIVDWFTSPCRVALVGPPNAGKSTLANALAGQRVSLVSPTPGTTRDWVEIPGEADGFPITWLDTAGLRTAESALEGEGIRRTQARIADAQAIIIVLDSTPEGGPARSAFFARYADLQPASVALNKCDASCAPADVIESLPAAWRARTVPISALHSRGLTELTAGLLGAIGRRIDLDSPAAFTDRQFTVLSAFINDPQPDRRTLLSALLELR
jgi:tRNA modification GTPase